MLWIAYLVRVPNEPLSFSLSLSVGSRKLIKVVHAMSFWFAEKQKTSRLQYRVPIKRNFLSVSQESFWNFQFQVIYSQTPGPTITFLLTREVQCVSCIVPVFIRTPIVFFMIQFNSLILFFHRIMYRNITESYLAFSAQSPHPPATPQGLRPLGQMEVW